MTLTSISRPPGVDGYWEDGQIYRVGRLEFQVIHCPGHTPGHVSFFRESDRTLIAGDAFVTTKQESTIAVLTQARPELIERTYEAIEGARRAIVHLYNSTSETQRRVVFRLDRDGITDLAVRATALCKRLAAETEIVPAFYDRDDGTVPRQWVRIVKEAIRSVTPTFSTRRMVKDYVVRMYMPAMQQPAERR